MYYPLGLSISTVTAWAGVIEPSCVLILNPLLIDISYGVIRAHCVWLHRAAPLAIIW